MVEINPRLEWRSFGRRFEAAEARLAALTPGSIQESDQTYFLGSSGNRVGKNGINQSGGSMQVRIFNRRYSSSRRPYARRWSTRILLLRPSTKPSETLFSGLQ